jgi:hypothetical protein
MNRRTATVCGAALALACGGAIVAMGQRIGGERQRERDAYRLELTRLRQEAARATEKADDAAPAQTTRLACTTGADSLTLAAYRAAPTPLLKDGRLDVARLTALSDQAVRAERFVEDAHEPPAQPHRLGVDLTPPACFPVSVSKPPSVPPSPAKNTPARRR